MVKGRVTLQQSPIRDAIQKVQKTTSDVDEMSAVWLPQPSLKPLCKRHHKKLPKEVQSTRLSQNDLIY